MVFPTPKIQPWVDYTHQEYELPSGETVIQYHCVQYESGIASHNFTDGGKVKIVKYADFTGIEPCPFVSMEPRYDNTNISEISVGKNYDRDLGGIVSGTGLMVYACGTTRPYQGMKIAPHPYGFQQWKPGMFLLGYVYSEWKATDVDFTLHMSKRLLRVRIDISTVERAVFDSITVTTHVGDLTASPDEIQFVNGTVGSSAGFKTLDADGIIGTVTAGEYIVYQTRRETCQAGGTATTVVLDSAASATNDIYKGMFLEIYDGTTFEKAVITGYVGSTKVATVSPALSYPPDATYEFHIVDPDGAWKIEFNSTDAITAAVVSYKTVAV